MSCEAHGLEFDMFMAKYLVAIEEYIMSGYGNGWTHCDIMGSNLQKSSIYEHIPHVAIEIENLKTIDLKATVSSSHCLFAMYEVESLQNLASLMEFGRRAIQHKRLALVIKMGSALSHKNPFETKKPPFLVAAQLENGKEKFICPAIGEVGPQEYMCDKSYVSLNGKMLHVGIVGIGPYFVGEILLAIIVLKISFLSQVISTSVTKNGIDGTDVRLLKLLAKKFDFSYNITNPGSYHAAIRLVCNLNFFFCIL